MRVDTEFFYQRECVALLLGIAMGRGIQIYQPADSEFLFASRLYGYEGGGLMIDRQLLDNLRKEYSENEETRRDIYQQLIGVMKALQEAFEKARLAFEKADKNGTGRSYALTRLKTAQEELNKHALETQKARDAAVGAAHMRSLLEKLLAEVDMEEPKHCEFELPAYLLHG
jgi:ABC-type phosphate transport system auxiliary subunit